MTMSIRVYLTICALFMCAPLSAQDLTPIGSFDNVRSGGGEEPHCYGYSLDLWRNGRRIVGLFDHHEGLCGDPPCEVLRDISYDPGTGRLTFSALGEAFVGTLRRDDVVGTINGRRVRLRRIPDWPMDADRDKKLEAWCRFWRGVPRCHGVDELCVSLGQER